MIEVRVELELQSSFPKSGSASRSPPAVEVVAAVGELGVEVARRGAEAQLRHRHLHQQSARTAPTHARPSVPKFCGVYAFSSMPWVYHLGLLTGILQQILSVKHETPEAAYKQEQQQTCHSQRIWRGQETARWMLISNNAGADGLQFEQVMLSGQRTCSCRRGRGDRTAR